jgi:hypothetical protein
MNHTSTTPIEENDLQLLLSIYQVIVKWATTKAYFIRNETWKFRQKELTIAPVRLKILIFLQESVLSILKLVSLSL